MFLKAPIGENVTFSKKDGETGEATILGFSEKGWLVYEADGTLWGKSLKIPEDCEEWKPENEKFPQARSAVFFPELVFKTTGGRLVESHKCDWKMVTGVNEFEKKQKSYKEFIKILVNAKPKK